MDILSFISPFIGQSIIYLDWMPLAHLIFQIELFEVSQTNSELSQGILEKEHEMCLFVKLYTEWAYIDVFRSTLKNVLRASSPCGEEIIRLSFSYAHFTNMLYKHYFLLKLVLFMQMFSAMRPLIIPTKHLYYILWRKIKSSTAREE